MRWIRNAARAHVGSNNCGAVSIDRDVVLSKFQRYSDLNTKRAPDQRVMLTRRLRQRTNRRLRDAIRAEGGIS